MDITELRALKNSLENELSGLIAAPLRKFQNETGCELQSITVDLVDATTYQDSARQYEPSVKLHIEV